MRLPWQDRKLDTRALLGAAPKILAHLTAQVNMQLQEDIKALHVVEHMIQEEIQPKLCNLSTNESLRNVDSGDFMNDCLKANDILKQALKKVKTLKMEFQNEQANHRGVPAM